MTATLAGADQLATVNVRSYRQMRLQAGIDYNTLVTNPRAGKVGLGVLVLMPIGLGKRPNVSGPVLDWAFPVVVLEQPQINTQTSIGTLISAEECCQRVMDVLHLDADERYGTFEVAPNAVAPEKEYGLEGCVGYRVVFFITAGKNLQTKRVAPVTISVAAGMVTLGCTDIQAQVYYTKDGSIPSLPIAGNANSLLYTAPFAAAPGTVVRSAAYKNGFNKSATRYTTV